MYVTGMHQVVCGHLIVCLFCEKCPPPMMGVSLCQCRVSIGRFNLIHVHINVVKKSKIIFCMNNLTRRSSLLQVLCH